jgi:hypothetical protein
MWEADWTDSEVLRGRRAEEMRRDEHFRKRGHGVVGSIEGLAKARPLDDVLLVGEARALPPPILGAESRPVVRGHAAYCFFPGAIATSRWQLADCCLLTNCLANRQRISSAHA